MADNFKKINKGQTFRPQTTTPGNLTNGDFWYDSSTNRFLGRVSGATDPFLHAATSATLSNKSIDATANTLSNISNSSIASGAAISYSKLNLSNSIVNADINTAAAIAYSKLSLTNSILNADINASAAIAYSKLNLTGSIVNADVNASAAIAYSKLNLALAIVNADISTSAAIAYSKLNLSSSIVNADVSASAAIAYSKLNLSASIVNADVSASAAIAYSKLSLSNSIVNADVNASAAIAYSKLALTGSIVNADINASAAIAYSKLNLALSIVNADVSASAAIAGTKISPNFGVQEVISTTRYYVGTGTGSGGSSAAGFEINNGNNLNGADVKGFYANFTSPSGATGSVRGLQINIGTSAAVYTSAQALGILVNPHTLGAGSSITNAVGVMASPQTVGTNNASFSDNLAFSGSWGLNLSTTNPSYIAGQFRTGTNAAIGAGAEQISSLITGVAVGTLSGAVVTQASRSDNAAITGNTRVISSNIQRSITTTQTDTGAYSWFLANSATITIPSGQTYTSSGTWAGFQYSAPSISGAGTAALSAIYGVLVGASATNYGTGKAGIAVGAQSGNTNNVGLLLGTTTIPSGTYELYSSGSNRSLFTGALGVGTDDTTSSISAVNTGVSNRTGSSQATAQFDTVSDATATATLSGVISRVRTPNSSFTTATSATYWSQTAVKGAANTMTRLVHFLGNGAQTSGTNNATLADNQTFSGNWFINSTDTNPSLFSGPFELKQQATPSNPSSGQNRLYFKSDGKLYTLDSSGTETLLATAGSGVSGPGSSTVDAIPRWANTSGTSLANSSISINSLNQVGLADGTISSGFLLTLLPSAANYSTITGSTTTGAGIRMTLNAPSSMTAANQGMVLRTNTSAAAFTLAVAEPILVVQDAVGAGSTITQWTGLRFLRNQASATNNALISDSNGYTGTWGIYLGSISDPSRILGALRLGSATADLVGTGPEQLTVQNISTNNALAVRGGVFQARLNSNSASTAAVNGIRGDGYRQGTASITESAQVSGGVFRTSLDIGNNTYTNNGTFVGNIQLQGLGVTGTPTIAIDNYALLYISADAVASGLRKTGVQINTISGATNNAFLSDNSSFVGNYFINSTSTFASVFSGALTVNNALNVSGNNSHFGLQVSTSNILTVSNTIDLGTHTINGQLLVAQSTNASIGIEVDNLSPSSNTAADAHLALVTGDASTSTRYAFIQYRNRDSTNTSWYTGTAGDNNYSIVGGGSVSVSGGSKFFTITNAGLLTLGASGGTQTHVFNGNFNSTLQASIGALAGSTSGYLYVGNQSASAGVLTAVNQQGLAIDYTVSSSATTGAQGVDSFIRTANVSWTLPVIANFKADGISKGAANTITRSIQYELSGALTVGTNNAGIADNESFTGNWLLNLGSAANPSGLAGRLIVGSATSNANNSLSMVTTSGNQLTGSTQIGFFHNFNLNSSATGDNYGFITNMGSAGAGITHTSIDEFAAGAFSSGGATITRLTQFRGLAKTVGANNAIFTDNLAYTGDWALNFTSTRASLLTGDLRLNSTARIFGNAEKFTLVSSDAAQANEVTAGAAIYTEQTGNTANTGGAVYGMYVETRRGATSVNVTDSTTDHITSGYFLTRVSPAGATTYTNTGNKGVSSLVVNMLQNVGGGTAAVSNHSALTIDGGTSVNLGTRKIGLRLLNQPSGSTNNAWIADNNGFTGDYFINSTSTSPTVISGAFANAGAVGASAMVKLNGNTLTGVSQYAVEASTFTGTSAATTGIASFVSGSTTANASFTCATRYQFFADNIAKGAASTITRDIGYFLNGGPSQGTNNASIADNLTFTGSWFINSASVKPSNLSAPLTLTLSDTTSGVSTGLRITGSSTGFTTSASQYGFYADPVFNSSATTEGNLFAGQIQTPAVAFTLPLATHFRALQDNLGAGSTITRLVNFHGFQQTIGTNNAFMADNSTFSGNFFIHQTGTAGSTFGGAISLPAGAVGTPALTFTGNGNMGIYNTSGQFNIATAGALRLAIDPSGNTTTTGGTATTGYDTSSPATGGTVTASANKPGVLITPAGTIATCTIKLPSTPFDGQQYWVACSQQITTVTWQDAGGTAGNVIGGPTTIGGTNKGARFIYNSSGTKWYNIG